MCTEKILTFKNVWVHLLLQIAEHQNWFGMDETLGPVAISLKRERVETDLSTNGCSSNTSVIFRYRIIIRTSEVNY